jgi:predicted GTPase
VRNLRVALLAVALLLPTASLIVLGSLWLWQHGYVLHWAFATCVAVAGVYYLQRRLLGPLAPAPQELESQEARDPGNQLWTPLQMEAWNDVMALAARVPAERLRSRDDALGLGLETIELVAQRLHAGRREPLLQFTVPEALAVIEQASGGLRDFILRSFPLGDRITVAQVMWLYRWRAAVGWVEKGYDLWRIVRLLNPLAAATQELRERFTRQIYEMGRDHLGRRLARAYVREVGRAAIDLYGGNLRVTREQLNAHVSKASRGDLAAAEARAAEPIRILVAGQSGAGKSSLVNALADEVDAAVDAVPTTTAYTAYKLTHEGLPAALIIDSPGIVGPEQFRRLIDHADDCDMVLWVSAATRAARELDRAALSAIREHFAGTPHRHRPPMLLVLTHVDTLRPFGEWQPPYDLGSGTRAKAQAIRAAVETAGAELGFAADEVVPVRADIAVAAYNIDALWAKIVELAPEARRAQLLRTLRDVKAASAWSSIWSQAVNAGRVLGSALLDRNRGARP